MRIITTKHLNLHSKSIDGGLIHVPARTPCNVPDDIVEHPAFKWLKKDGSLVVISDSNQAKVSRIAKRPVSQTSANPDEDDDLETIPASNPSLIPTASPLTEEEEDEDEEDEEDEEE